MFENCTLYMYIVKGWIVLINILFIKKSTYLYLLNVFNIADNEVH